MKDAEHRDLSRARHGPIAQLKTEQIGCSVPDWIRAPVAATSKASMQRDLVVRAQKAIGCLLCAHSRPNSSAMRRPA